MTPLNVTLQIIRSVGTIGKTMIFANTIEHADFLAKIFTILSGTRVESYHSNTVGQKSILDNFRNGTIMVIVAVSALDEGFDDCEVNLILNFSVYVRRVRKMIQRIGRSLRLRTNRSSAIYLSVKILPDDLQLLPCNYITGGLEDTHISVPDCDLIDETKLSMNLPEIMNYEDESGVKEIKPRGAAITFPKRRRQLLLGSIPQEIVQYDYGVDYPILDSSFRDIDENFLNMLNDLF